MSIRPIFGCLLLLVALLAAQEEASAQTPAAPTPTPTPAVHGVEPFWSELKKLCGKAFAGTIASDTSNSPDFAGKSLVMHVRSCEPDSIRIPFFVGQDRSRTWVLTKKGDRILLKHDHRHKDGTPDEVTMYGGSTTKYGVCPHTVFPC